MHKIPTVRAVPSLVCFYTMMAIAMSVDAEEKRPIDGIMDNSFFIEEAYNQEEGIVQHIFNGVYGREKFVHGGTRTFDASFTQEWPVMSQTHQFSYTVPYGFVWGEGQSANGVGDVLLHYRYQAYLDTNSLTAFSPRMSLVLPTGAFDKGFGNHTLGYQWNLPFSTTFRDRWFLHLNAGLTYLPGAGAQPTRDLLSYNLGGSVIYCVNDRFNLMCEWVGNWNQDVANNGRLERQFSSVISPGVRYAINPKDETQIVLGLATPFGITRSAPDIGAFLYFSFEHRLFGNKTD
ncbi:MAG: hypothetical protein JWO95_276 [Verrucomicrobiales bacterium]|nr:hypothetical protein [Verrucomicrobiales bacterium]